MLSLKLLRAENCALPQKKFNPVALSRRKFQVNKFKIKLQRLHVAEEKKKNVQDVNMYYGVKAECQLPELFTVEKFKLSRDQVFMEAKTKRTKEMERISFYYYDRYCGKHTHTQTWSSVARNEKKLLEYLVKRNAKFLRVSCLAE